ncbi:hypothetical protein I7I50_00903 [Histoplasma capsulatum G186AR]|uniref:Uncharacterized protein n=1 Tax=Ajellomyces capsulatus TaxID=5037 RepID=A0A8H7YK78_AJECA|nr:hypothetical protein I7I52_08169 [Histoplasma capsulatum]QSS72911.1 hypothetical protein I7I50_00903 [Histoplasma capsulatum G186AR]
MRGTRIGPVTSNCRSSPPVVVANAWANPSPPSNNGTFRTIASGRTRLTPFSMQSATASVSRLSLNPDGQMRMLRGGSAFACGIETLMNPSIVRIWMGKAFATIVRS